MEDCECTIEQRVITNEQWDETMEQSDGIKMLCDATIEKCYDIT